MREGNSQLIIPSDAVIALTYNCNSRCIMCNNWNYRSGETIDPKQYEKLPGGLKNIGITGGEPTLREDMAEVIAIIKNTCPKAKITISTNGLYAEKTKEQMAKVYKIDSNIGVAVSIDGEKETNDKIRGVPGAYENAVKTVSNLKDTGFKDIRVSYTICNDNSGDIGNIYNYCKNEKIAFTCGIVQNSENYFKKTDNVINNSENIREKLNYVITEELKSSRIKKWFMAYYVYGLYHKLASGRRILGCGALRNYFYLDPAGNVYPCVFRSESAGNISDYKTFYDLWAGAGASAVRDATKICRNSCWQLCTARAPISNNMGLVSLWILKNKIKTLAGGNKI